MPDVFSCPSPERASRWCLLKPVARERAGDCQRNHSERSERLSLKNCFFHLFGELMFLKCETIDITLSIFGLPILLHGDAQSRNWGLGMVNPKNWGWSILKLSIVNFLI